MSNITEAPTGIPTLSPTDIVSTDEPTPSPTPLPTSAMTTAEPTTTPPPTNHVDVIRLPDYKSHDTVDGFFLGIGSFILLIMLVLCLQRVNLDRRRLMNRFE